MIPIKIRMGLLIRFIFWAILTAMTPTRVEMKVLNRIGINTFRKDVLEKSNLKENL